MGHLKTRTVMKTPGIAKHFGTNLARCRRRARLSQEELGVRASLHRTAVGQLERGERVARMDTFIKLMGACGASPTELLDGLSWTPGDTIEGSYTVIEPGDDG